jgi:hypothetical protein
MELFTIYTRLAFGATMIAAALCVLLEQIVNVISWAIRNWVAPPRDEARLLLRRDKVGHHPHRRSLQVMLAATQLSG